VREADPRSRRLGALDLTCRPRTLLLRRDLIGACSCPDPREPCPLEGSAGTGTGKDTL
jgi:hypothetical protein